MKKEKKTTEIATNVSSGADKVEVVSAGVKAKKSKTVPEKGKKVTVVEEEKIDVKKGASEDKKTSAIAAMERAERESEAAKARVAAALKKQEEKKKKETEKQKRAEEREAKREAYVRERAHNKATRAQEHAKAQARRRKLREERGGKNNSNGGWIAAVVSLGAVTLALTTAVTIGAIDMKNTKDGVMSGYKSTTYELVGLMEHVDDDLDRVRVSNSPAQQQRILTDLLVQVRLFELDLEKLPVTAEADRNLTTFINRVGAECERMLSKLRHGETLSERDGEILERLYEVNHEARQKLDEFVSKMSDDMIMDYLKNGEGDVGQVIEDLENITLEENRAAKGEREPRMAENHQKEGAGKERNAMPHGKEGGFEPKIDTSKAEELCEKYFASYEIEEFRCVGETVTRDFGAYNVQGYDAKGTLLFAEIDWKSGALVRFNYYEPCNEETFDLDNSKLLAESFLEKLGYEDMAVAHVRENGTDANFTFVYRLDGVSYYPDAVEVKVCRTRGLVTGMDATKFLRNHTTRTEPNVSLTLETAQAKLRTGVDVEASKLCVVKAMHGERTAYEFLCSYQDEKYFIYVDANTGEEISVINAKSFS